MQTAHTGLPVIVLDGPAGAGKSSAAKSVAHRLGLPFLDTGAIYRAITLIMLREGIPPEESAPGMAELLESFTISFDGGRVVACGEDVTSAIRTEEIDRAVSPYSALPSVRKALLGLQRAQRHSGLVAEGRDMGTEVFPDADLKIFLTAAPEARARRRYDERIARGEDADYEAILSQVNRRDEIDTNRTASPLRQAHDAVYFDTTDCTLEQVIERILEYASVLRPCKDGL